MTRPFAFQSSKSGGTAAYTDPADTINFRNESIGSSYRRRCLYWARTLTRHHKIHEDLCAVDKTGDGMEIIKIFSHLSSPPLPRMMNLFNGRRTCFVLLVSEAGERCLTATGWLSFLPVAPLCRYDYVRRNHRREESRMEYNKMALCRIVPGPPLS